MIIRVNIIIYLKMCLFPLGGGFNMQPVAPPTEAAKKIKG